MSPFGPLKQVMDLLFEHKSHLIGVFTYQFIYLMFETYRLEYILVPEKQNRNFQFSKSRRTQNLNQPTTIQSRYVQPALKPRAWKIKLVFAFPSWLYGGRFVSQPICVVLIWKRSSGHSVCCLIQSENFLKCNGPTLTTLPTQLHRPIHVAHDSLALTDQRLVHW